MIFVSLPAADAAASGNNDSKLLMAAARVGGGGPNKEVKMEVSERDTVVWKGGKRYGSTRR